MKQWDCSNHQGITLLSIPGKFLAHILLRRIRDHLLRHKRPEKSRFTPGKSTIDHILALRVIDFEDLLGEPVQSVRARGEDLEVTESFTYLDSVVHNSGLSDQEVTRQIGLKAGVMNSLNKSSWRCRHLCRGTKLRLVKYLIMPVLLYSSETWTLSCALEFRLDAFCNRSWRRIMGYCLQDHVSNLETGIGSVICTICDRQLRLYSHLS
ncbi:uncharacterized protein [Penaeus vannamei]|uniref:uncharacterized protein n=1 Tax=Penaeus vannamei TaxID=6689 RepID=UPI00387F9EC2